MAFDNWTVTPNLWGLAVGVPGVMKSPALSEGLRPLERLQNELATGEQARHDVWKIDQQRAELIAAVNRKKARKLLTEDRDRRRCELAS